MKAFFAGGYGGPEVMSFGELPDPTPRKGQAVVQVRAASINPVDWKVRQGEARILTGTRFPKVLGTDFSGVVSALGPGASELAVGQAVYGLASVMFGSPGAHAEKVAVPAKRLRRLPEGLGFEAAAAVPVAGLTAQNGLRRCGDLAGKRVVVNGATGGVGHFAVQLAKARGAVVTAVCSGRNANRARALGADRVIDYHTQDFTQSEERYDVVFDAFGKLGFQAAARVLSARGAYVTTLGSPSLFFRGIWRRVAGGPRIVFANLRARQEDYAAFEAELLAGRVVPVVEHVFPLARAAEAFAAVESGGVVGKVVITVGAGGA